MFIKQIVIEGVEGDVEIYHTDYGAQITNHDVVAEVARTDTFEARWGVAWNAAKVVCGTTRRDEPNATHSMIWEVLREIDRVAGC